jgi:hypothetical protein
MKRETGFWRSFDVLVTGEAVPADWRREMGAEFEAGNEYLQCTGRWHDRHPCTSATPCGCEHRVGHLGGERFSAACSCPEADCPTFRLQREDVLLHRVDAEGLGGSIRRAFGFEKPELKLRNVLHCGWGCIAGGLGPKRHPAVLLSCLDENELLWQLDELLEFQMECGLIMTPTARLHTEVVVEKARRNKSALMALGEYLTPEPGWQMRVVRSIAPVLSEVGRAAIRAQRRATADSEAPKASRGGAEIITCGKLRYLPGFADVWFGEEHYDLRERTMARLCIQYLVEQEAFEPKHGRHLLDEIDPYVRKQSGQPRAVDVRIDHYFVGPKGRLRRLRKELIKAVGMNGRFYLNIH